VKLLDSHGEVSAMVFGSLSNIVMAGIGLGCD